MKIRRLNKDDLQLIKNIRLELLKNNPSSFGSSYEQERDMPEHMWITRISKSSVKYYGAFDGEELIGITVMSYSPRIKMQHASTVNSVYVKPNHRKKGIAKQLILMAIEDAKHEGVEFVKLNVVSLNQNAHLLYKKLGFVEYGRDPYSIKYEGKYYPQVMMYKRIQND